MEGSDKPQFKHDPSAKVYSDLSILTGAKTQAGPCKRIIGKFRLYVNAEGNASIYTVLDTQSMQVYSASGNFNKVIMALAKKQW